MLLTGAEPAEILIELSAEDSESLARGTLQLPAGLAARQFSYRGPVRKYLAVHPVLRGLLLDLDGGVL